MSAGGDVKSMTKDDKISFTLRIKKTLDQKIEQASEKMGVSKNAFILMILSEKLEKN
jgi:predicted HicB family RNase H-like nuclease